MKRIFVSALFIVILTACTSTAVSTEPVTSLPVATATETATSLPVQTDAPTETTTGPTATATIPAESWQSIPVIPTGLSQAMLEVYQRGLAAGRDPSRFSKIGDCQNIIPYFLAPFDDAAKYRLGDEYAYLQPTIDHFAGSWERASVATHGGFNAATALSPFWTVVARPDVCTEGESPAACELRLYNPSFAIISMEEDWSGDTAKFDRYTRLLVEYVLAQNVVPILGTRAEWPDAKIQLNAIITRIAYDYQIPLWNFGAATLALPSYGLTEDGFHLTPKVVEGNYFFDDPARMELGWVWRNLTALQAIDAVYNGTIQP